jgi:hypothetical protein
MSSSLIKALINSTIKEENKLQPLTITCTASTSSSKNYVTLKISQVGSTDVTGLQYRKGTSGAWETLPIKTILNIPVGESWQFQNTNDILNISASNYVNFYLDNSSASVKLTGNVNSLINYKDLSEYCFFNLFYQSSSTSPKIDASELILPATTLAKSCYYGMFKNCRNLISAPKLPATTLADSCYCSMFNGCTSLTTAPELPATTLADYCYNAMFDGCTSLTTAPELPATTLATVCYGGMFYNCKNLTTAPFLPAEHLVQNCYSNIFYGCSSLNYIKVGFLESYINNASYLRQWVQNVSPTGTFASTTKFNTLTFGQQAIPEGWTIEGRNIIYVTNQNASLPILKNFEQSITYTTLPATDKPATFTIAEGELPETIELTNNKFTGYVETEQSFNIKVKIEIDGYEPAYSTLKFNFYKEAKLADYKLYIPLNNIDTVSVNDGDAVNQMTLSQYTTSNPVKFVEQEGRWSFENWKVAEISGGSGYSAATLVGKNVGYQKLPSGNNPWSISFTMKLKQYSTDTSKSVNVIQIGYGYSTGNHIRFGLMPYNGKAYFYLDTYNMDDANFSDAAKESRIIELDTWYEIVVTYQDKTLNYYYNNELIATTTLANNLDVKTTSSSTYFYIGGYSNESGWRSNSTECYMKDLLLFNRVLSETEVDTLFKKNLLDVTDDFKNSIYLNATNFTAEDASYYNVSTLNGEYYLVDKSLTGVNKVYKNKDNGIFILYNKELNCWMFSLWQSELRP